MSYLRPQHRGQREPLEVVYHALLWTAVWSGTALVLWILWQLVTR